MTFNLADDSNSPVRLTGPVPDLVVESMTGEEELGRPFVYYLTLLSNDHELQFDKIIGQTMTVKLNLSVGTRYFHGYVSEFSCDVPDEGFARYSAVLRPWFWLLTQTADCRIFQNKTIPEIIKEVFRDNGMNDFDFHLGGQYEAKDYCVQYRESDFNFISRLMENEGIYYYFKHQESKHTMVLVDDSSAHATFPGHDTVSYMIGGDRQEIAGVMDFWTAKQSIMPSKYASRDFNFENPGPPWLEGQSNTPVKYSTFGNPEIFDYPGEYPNKQEGARYARIRLEEIQCQQERLQGSGTYRGIAAGYTLKLENHFRKDQNKEYLVVSVQHTINNAAFITSTTSAQEVYRCQAEFIYRETPFRPARVTRKPVVQGPQTAIVVGQNGEEIFTDEHGRVKVQFHWDRQGKHDENSSCWIRVSQAWAGENWGSIHIPRVDQEVIVNFMEGDPDQPIITGRVYNADRPTPYKLPANKTQSGFLSRSTKAGTEATNNEFRFEDKKGEEEIYLHAEKDLNTHVKEGNYTETLDKGNFEQTILEGNFTRTLEKGNFTETLQLGDVSYNVEKGKSTTRVDQNIATESAKGDISIEAKLGKISLKAMKEITLTVGTNTIKIDQKSITVSATMVTVEGKATTEVKSPATTVKGDGMLTLKGGVTMIN